MARAELPFEVVATDEIAQTRMEGHDVIVLEVDLDKGFPVVIAFVDFHAVEHVAGKVQVRALAQRAQFLGDSALACEQQPVPVLQWGLGQIEAGIVRKVGRAQQFAASVIGPAVQRADDVARVAAAFEHDGLAVAADVGQ